MKGLFLIGLVAVLLFSGCSNSTDTEDKLQTQSSLLIKAQGDLSDCSQKLGQLEQKWEYTKSSYCGFGPFDLMPKRESFYFYSSAASVSTVNCDNVFPYYANEKFGLPLEFYKGEEGYKKFHCELQSVSWNNLSSENSKAQFVYYPIKYTSAMLDEFHPPVKTSEEAESLIYCSCAYVMPNQAE